MTDPSIPRKRPCKFAVEGPAGYECSCYRKTYCADQIPDYNPDGKVNVVTCGLDRKEKFK